jgi:hypothetical protein
MPEQQALQSIESGDGVVTEVRSLAAFISFNAYANVRGLNHINIVSAIPNC